MINQEGIPWCFPCNESHKEWHCPRNQDYKDEHFDIPKSMNFVKYLDPIYIIPHKTYTIIDEQMKQIK